jgi:hypothetical protein
MKGVEVSTDAEACGGKMRLMDDCVATKIEFTIVDNIHGEVRLNDDDVTIRNKKVSACAK